ncbi:MAG: response regulator [Chloroflexi bacterium]|nr:response regulator [Chloroflexota bacterium]
MARATILLAEDEDSIRTMCFEALRGADYQVAVAANGTEAVETARSFAPDRLELLVTDLRMPDLDGLEVAREIRRLHPALGIVIITGYGSMDAAIEALKEGASEFVLKPFRSDEFLEAIARTLHKRRLERENARLRTLIPLFDLSRALMGPVDMETIPQYIVRIAQEEMRADSASLMLVDDQGKLSIHAAEGLPPEVILQTHQSIDEGIAGYVLAHRRPMILQGDKSSDPRFAYIARESEVRSAISLPLVYQDHALGVLNVSRREETPPFTEGDIEFLSVLATQAAIALENARLFQELQEAYRRLAELDHLKSEFISIASHELRAPLAVLLAYATLSEAEASGPLREHLEQVQDSAMQLKSIIDEMVSLRRIDTGEAQVRLINVHIAPIISGVLEELGPLASRGNLSVSVDVPEDIPAVRADEQVVRLILSSLVSNAIKYTPARGSVTVRARQDRDRVCVDVEDTGIGIPAEALERIFDRFYQVEDSLRREHGGIGLGLAIAREMAELIDAEISVTSELHKGSCFTLSLPVASED